MPFDAEKERADCEEWIDGESIGEFHEFSIDDMYAAWMARAERQYKTDD